MRDVKSEIKPKRALGTLSMKRKFTGNLPTRKQSKSENDSPNKSASQRKIISIKIIIEFLIFKDIEYLILITCFFFLDNLLCCKACSGRVKLKKKFNVAYF